MWTSWSVNCFPTRRDAPLTCWQIYLDYVLFMQTLVKEAAIESKKSGERGITARSVKKVTADTLTKFKG
ncbi:Inner kinetochore subunit wip1 [Colletotrichum sp. SAR11_240]|nr:Inner kinetochore subunit wip1 [Colletotrichum sp. SAR11_240]